MRSSALRERFVGIVNGIDQDEWDPGAPTRSSPRATRADDLGGKKRCKAALQRVFGLPQRARMPIFGMSARHGRAEGPRPHPRQSRGSCRSTRSSCSWGRARSATSSRATELAARAGPHRRADQLHRTQEHRLMAGADMIIMPSQYEPCGLTQMRAQRYGTIPVARTRGRARRHDRGRRHRLPVRRVHDGEFLRALHPGDRLLPASRHAGRRCMREAMSRDFGWERSEQKYRDLYRRVLAVATRSGGSAMNQVDLVVMLHSHLPYVLNHGRWPHGSDWICEAAIDTYLPLVEKFRALDAHEHRGAGDDRLHADPGEPARAPDVRRRSSRRTSSSASASATRRRRRCESTRRRVTCCRWWNTGASRLVRLRLAVSIEIGRDIPREFRRLAGRRAGSRSRRRRRRTASCRCSSATRASGCSSR